MPDEQVTVTQGHDITIAPSAGGSSDVSPPYGSVIGKPPVSTSGRTDEAQIGLGDAGAVLKGRRPQ